MGFGLDFYAVSKYVSKRCIFVREHL